MERTTGKKGMSRLRIIDSDSESDSEDDDRNQSVFDDDIDKLSKSMKRVQLIDEESNETDSDCVDLDHTRTCFSPSSFPENEKNHDRKPPRGRNPRRLEDFSWSSSDEESEGRYLTSCSPKKGKTKKSAAIGSIISRKKSYSSDSSSSKANSSTILSSDRKTSKPKTPYVRKKSFTAKPILSRVKRTNSFDSSFSNSSSSSLSTSSSSDDDYPLVKSKLNKKKGFSWSFNKNRQEYTIGGNDKIPAFSIPSDLYDKLYDFQKDGVAWMAGLYLPKIGGILGDDMGMVNCTKKVEIT